MASRLPMIYLIIIVLSSLQCQAHLSPNFYDETCPKALKRIRKVIRSAVSHERRMAASLIRLHFHDCFVQGCDASILLDDTVTFRGEKTALPNNNSVRGYEVIDKAKAQVEKICPGIVSCADIVSVAARDASVAVGGPSWIVKLGRRDSITANRSLAEQNNLPGFTDSLENLISNFARKGLNQRDMVALSGAHTVGKAQCFTFRERIYNSTNDIDPGFARARRHHCAAEHSPENNSTLAPMDFVTPKSFDNQYFKNIVKKKGLLPSDQVLFSGGTTDSIVLEYRKSSSTFESDFASAMIKMGDIEVLTGTQGQVRKFCNLVN